MLASILVATPHAAFGELLHISLEDSGQFQTRLVMSAREVRASASRGNFQLAILDAALGDEIFVPLCKDLLELQKGIRLIVIPPDNDPNHPSLGGLIPHGYLIRPFYLPDLINTVTLLLNQRSLEFLEQKQIEETFPPWLADPLTIQKYLESELPITQALAGIIGLHEPTHRTGTLRAHAGQLTESAAQEIAEVVFRYWSHNEKTDLMRFIRISSDKKDYLIYTTQLIGELVLILVYDSNAPLSQIRPQTKSLAKKLAGYPPQDVVPAEIYPPVESPSPKLHETSNSTPDAGRHQIVKTALPRPDLPDEEESTQPDVWESPIAVDQSSPGSPPAEDILQSLRMIEPVEDNSETLLLQATTEEDQLPLDDVNLINRINNAISPDSHAEIEAEDDAHSIESISLSALLGSIPSPDPGKEPIGSGWVPEPPALFPGRSQLAALNNWENDKKPEQESEPTEGIPPISTNNQAADLATIATPDQHSGVEPSSLNWSLAPEEDNESLEDTRPHIIAALTSLSQLEPSSLTLSQINYTCVLIPRLPQHYLTGELADRLAYWVQQLCLAFGWRLEGIAIRPGYLQWTVQVSPSISPGNLVRIVRQRTSLHIFNQFSHLGDQNPSGDFWATGYLIVSGAQPPSAQLLRDYIAQTRKRQGIIK